MSIAAALAALCAAKTNQPSLDDYTGDTVQEREYFCHRLRETHCTSTRPNCNECVKLKRRMVLSNLELFGA